MSVFSKKKTTEDRYEEGKKEFDETMFRTWRNLGYLSNFSKVTIYDAEVK
ncbi:MAG: hypothetical protein LBT48_05685 [Prevotellaceae bacterium]|jgi:hypothetical protein|nr:hypothetical protein [Prevotellaceae bacterium]